MHNLTSRQRHHERHPQRTGGISVIAGAARGGSLGVSARVSRVEVLSLLILLFSELFCARLSGLRRIAVAVHSTHALRTCTSAAQALCPIRVGGGSRLEPSATESIRCTLERTPPHQRHRRCSVRHVTCGWPGAVCAHCERTFRESIEGRSQRQVVGGSAHARTRSRARKLHYAVESVRSCARCERLRGGRGWAAPAGCAAPR